MPRAEAAQRTRDVGGEAPAPARRRARRPATRTQRERRWALVFLSPWIVGFLVFLIGPMLWSLYLSFTDYDPLVGSSNLVGLDNYAAAFADPAARRAAANTVFFTVFYVPGTIVSGLGLAVMLDRVGRAAGFFRTVFYLPNVAPAVAVGALFLLVLNGREGLLNRALGTVGIPGPSWLNDPAFVRPGIIMMMLWSVGSTVIILYAALRNVPQDLEEAAMVDGASSWQRFRRITVPMISGALFFVLIINTIASLQMFTEVYAMFFGQQPSGAASQAALFYVVHLFRQAFQFFDMGYASALAWLLFLVIGAITAVQIVVSRRWVYYEGGR